jgi:methyl-accepting chemotaxis protein
LFLLDVASAVFFHTAARIGQAIGKAQLVRGAMSDLGAEVEGAGVAMSDAIYRLEHTSTSLAESAMAAASGSERTEGWVPKCAEQVSSSASASEELSASLQTIRHQTTISSEKARDAADRAVRSNVSMRQLAEAVTKIGSATEVIAAIARQTNLLALNATIEASRAGPRFCGRRERGEVVGKCHSKRNRADQRTHTASAECNRRRGPGNDRGRNGRARNRRYRAID